MVVSSVVVVVLLTEGPCLSSSAAQAENDRMAAVARQERMIVFMIDLCGIVIWCSWW